MIGCYLTKDIKPGLIPTATIKPTLIAPYTGRVGRFLNKRQIIDQCKAPFSYSACMQTEITCRKSVALKLEMNEKHMVFVHQTLAN